VYRCGEFSKSLFCSGRYARRVNCDQYHPQELTANRKCSAVLENYNFLTATALSEKSEFIEVWERIFERDFNAPNYHYYSVFAEAVNQVPNDGLHGS
jgi:hypothetical protein